MLKHRFFPYILGACVIVILAVSFVGARAYIRQIEVKGAEEVLALEKRILESETPSAQEKQFEIDAGFDVENITHRDAKFLLENEKRQLEVEEWHKTGKLTPQVEAHFEMLESWVQQSENAIVTDVIQQIVTPDGTIHQVVVPKHQQYEEGDAILKSEIVDEEYLNTWYRSVGETYQEIPREKSTKVVLNNVTYPMPDEYYDIEDPYEQLEYTTKFIETIVSDISMDEVEQMVASGELDVSLRESEKRMVDESQAEIERGHLEHQLRMLARPKMPPLSDKPPVKVSFLPDEGEGAKREWVRKTQRKSYKDRLGDVAQPQISEHESGIDDPRRPNHRSDSLELPAEHPQQQRITPSKQAMEDSLTSSPESLETLIEAQISPEERMKATLSEKLSPAHKGKTLPFLTPDDPEEELRRLREAGSEGEKQREQHGDRADAPPSSR